MMVETILESSQDFSMSTGGALPQWKRELLQRRLARSRPCLPSAHATAPPPPPLPPPLAAAADDDEELRYGPGIVKRLKSRYLSLALRDAPRRRPSVLRRAASLEHLLDERPPPPAPRATPAPRPASLVAAAPVSARPAARRDLVKRARSVDALSRLEARDEPPPPPSPERLAPAPALGPRAPRPPRRPRPLLRDAERPPPDVVRSTLRKFESAPPRRAAPAARLSAVMRRSPAPEGRSPSPVVPPDSPQPPLPTETPPPIPTSPIPDAPRSPPPTVPVEKSAPSSPPRSPAPAPAPAPTLEARPAPAPRGAFPPTAVACPRVVRTARTDRSPTEPAPSPTPSPGPGPATSVDEVEGAAASSGCRRVSRAALEEIARAGCSVRYAFGSPRVPPGPAAAPALAPAPAPAPLSAINPVLAARGLRRVCVIRPMPAAASPSPPPVPVPLPMPVALEEKVESRLVSPERTTCTARVNGHSTPEPGALSRIGAAGIERAWSGSAVKHLPPAPSPVPAPAPAPAWSRAGAGGRGRAPPAAATSVVFNFSNRKEVPDYIENDGIILRASRRARFKAGEPGVVVLRPDLVADAEGESDGEGGEEEEARPPSPCDVRFVNDNVLINGKSSMPAKHNKERIAKLKLQFDDSLTRTFEYPSESSLCEELPPCAQPPAPGAEASPPCPCPAPPHDNSASLADNTHIASAALSRYTPSKSCAAAFQLGVGPQAPDAPAATPTHPPPAMNGSSAGASEGSDEGDARPCGADLAKSWSDARAHHTDLLF